MQRAGGTPRKRPSRRRGRPVRAIRASDAYRRDAPFPMKSAGMAVWTKRSIDTQTAALARAGVVPGPDFDFTANVDTSFARTCYPLDAAVEADLGRTALNCYKKAAVVSLSDSYRRNRLAGLDQAAVKCDVTVYKSCAETVAESIENRLTLRRLAAFGELGCCRAFRRASSALQVEPDSIRQIARATLLFGDIRAHNPDMHLTTLVLCDSIFAASIPFLRRLEEAEPDNELAFGAEWADAVMAALEPLLPPPPSDRSPTADEAKAGYTMPHDGSAPEPDVHPPFKKRRPPTIDDEPAGVPLAANADVPSFLRRKDPRASAKSSGGVQADSAADQLTREIQRLGKNLEKQAKAAGSDFSAHGTATKLGRSEGAGPHQGPPLDAFLVEAGDSSSASISEGIYDPCLDSAEVRKIEADARPIERIVNDKVLPGRRDDREYHRFRRSGPMLDAKRIDLALVEENVFQVNRPSRSADGAGRSTLVLLADISGSMTEPPMRALKAVTTAWLKATAGKPTVQVLSGAYHTTAGKNRIRWSWNRNLSIQPRAQAHRSVASMPNKGEGGQADAASIRHAVNSALAVDPSASITLILLSDCIFCKSGSASGVGPDDEVANTIDAVREELPGRFQFVVIALGKTPGETVRAAADETVVVPADELKDFEKIACRISDSAVRQVNRSRAERGSAA